MTSQNAAAGATGRTVRPYNETTHSARDASVKLLLTGFEPFGGLAANPSQLIVEAVRQRKPPRGIDELVTAILPVTFGEAGHRVRQLIRAHRPDAVVGVGVARGSEAIHLERAALNIDDSATTDNANTLRQGQLIDPHGPVGYWSTLPLEAMFQALAIRGIPVAFSNHAGTYICNHTFYSARRELGDEVPCGLIHVPLTPELAAEWEEELPSLPLEVLVQAVECCLEVVGASPNRR
jgi:pyroglutamyl-peptidase